MFTTLVRAWPWMAAAAPSERAMLEAFFLWIYTARAHDDGTVAAIIDDALAFEHPQSPEGFARQLEAWSGHDTFDRLPAIDVPTLVVAGGQDIATPARMGRVVAERIPGARLVELPDEAHQPFQERPAEFNELVARFWATVDAGNDSGSPR
jgi:pimeloyl-ACP methyl ester carboxylesterase